MSSPTSASSAENSSGTSAPRGGARTLEGLERALDVLLLFTEPGATSLGVSEISRSLDLPKAVVHRILTTLCSRDFLELNESTRRYTLGPSWLVMGSTYAQRVDVRDLARDTLRQLSIRTAETTTISIRHGNHRVYLDQVTPNREVIVSVQVGARYPLHAGSSSKAFLAFLTPEEQADYLESIKLVSITEQTVVDETRLAQELAAIRQRGYAVSFGERQQGAGAIAAPLLDFESKPVAVLSICGPEDRIRDNVDMLAQDLLAETRELSARLGHTTSSSAVGPYGPRS